VALVKKADILRKTLKKLRLVVPIPEEVSFGDRAIYIEGGPYIPKKQLFQQILDKLRQHSITKIDEEHDK
jgi:hypothetical protein